eukprot:1795516-Pyramimonas_sp.AAC.1
MHSCARRRVQFAFSLQRVQANPTMGGGPPASVSPPVTESRGPGLPRAPARAARPGKANGK